jgi:hypothetical protein
MSALNERGERFRRVERREHDKCVERARERSEHVECRDHEECAE